MKKQQLYILGETLGKSKNEMDNVLKNKSTIRNLDECRISVMFSNNYKAGTTYGTISTRESYKAGTHYGTISVKDLIDLNQYKLEKMNLKVDNENVQKVISYAKLKEKGTVTENEIFDIFTNYRNVNILFQ